MQYIGLGGQGIQTGIRLNKGLKRTEHDLQYCKIPSKTRQRQRGQSIAGTIHITVELYHDFGRKDKLWFMKF